MSSLLNGAPLASTDDCPTNDPARLSDVRAVLSALHERESKVTARLNALLETQSDLSRELRRLDLLGVGLGSVPTCTIGNKMLAGAADTASRLSYRVKALDLEKRRG